MSQPHVPHPTEVLKRRGSPVARRWMGLKRHDHKIEIARAAAADFFNQSYPLALGNLELYRSRMLWLRDSLAWPRNIFGPK